MRLQTEYHQHRTDTGRLSSGLDSTDPEKRGRAKVQVQNWPKALRDCVVAEPGKLLVGADWSAIEWCIAMWFADKLDTDGYHIGLLDRFQSGEIDSPHRILAAELYQKSLADVSNKERQIAKSFTFGYLYGGSPDTLSDNARLPRDVGLNACDAHDRIFKLQEWRTHTVSEAESRNYIETAGGWRRYFWARHPKPTEVLASLVQGTAADLMKYILVQAFESCPAHVELLTTTHDAILAQVDEAQIDSGARWLEDQMTQPIHFLGGRGWRVKVKVGKTWRDVS